MLRLVLVMALILCGCSLPPAASPDPYDIEVSNGTTLNVAIVVNGREARVVAGGGGSSIPASTLGPLPWDVEARTASGRVLTTMTVATGSTGCTDDPGGAVRSCQGVVAMVDLSCGRFEMHTNGSAFSGGPAPGAGVPGDCKP